MSHRNMQAYEDARKLIDQLGGGDFDGAKPEGLVVRAEKALGFRFPPSYRRFLLELGSGNIRGVEIYGLIDADFANSTVPNGVWLTLNERKTVLLDAAYLIIGEGGDGTYYALDTHQVDNNGESPIVLLTVDGRKIETVAATFEKYLLQRVLAAV